MQICIVIPCLNEAANLGQTCQSLGFPGSADARTHLVLVDNGSQDQTLEVMRGIQAVSPPGQVHIVQEPQRGYVPARDAGARFVAASGMAFEHSALILQADADTIYLPGYVQAMRHAAHERGRGHVFEGACVTAAQFRRQYQVFDDLCRGIDQQMSDWFVRVEDEVVVDDKVSGFFLEDYIAWGGHRSQRTSTGAELLAETTRLYIAAKQGFAARKAAVDTMAVPSRRKLDSQPLAYFASAGFPRNAQWSARWTQAQCGSARAFLREPDLSPCFKQAVDSRRRHELALFALLPVLVDSKIARTAKVSRILWDVAPSSATTLLEQVLVLADDEHGPLERAIRSGGSLL